MKETILLFPLAVAFALFSGIVYAQSIYFTTPTNGQIITTYSSETTVTVNVQISGTPANDGYIYYYLKLFTNNGTYDNKGSDVIPTTFNLTTSTYSFRAELWEGYITGQEFKTASNTVTFSVMFPVTVNNSFAGGTVNINDTTKPAGTTVNKFVGDILNVGAIDQSDGTNDRVWNTSGTNNSNWLRTPYAGNQLTIPGASTRNYAYTVQSNDNQATITADLKRNFAINLNYQSEFNGTEPQGTIAHIVEQNNGTVTTPKTYNTQWPYTFAGWTDNFSDTNSRIITPTGNTTLTSVYKWANHSDSANAYTNNSQRKFIRTPGNNFLHMVYQSMGHVWWETSQDGGKTWQIMNNGNPLDNGAGKLPSIDYNGGNFVAIVFQQKYGNNYTLEIRNFEYTNQQWVLTYSTTAYTEYFDSYSVNANPNIAITRNHYFVLTWERKANEPFSSTYSGINYRYGVITYNDVYWSKLISVNNGPSYIPGTDNNSVNNSTYANKTSDPNYMIIQIAWEQDAWTKTISYSSIKSIDNNNYILSSVSNISSGDGYLVNYRPSIVGMPDGSAKVCWMGDYSGDGSTVNTIYRDLNSNTFSSTGYNVRSTSLNLSDDNTACYVSWSTNYGGSAWSNSFADVSNPYNTKTLNTSGQDIQLSNGSGKDSMYVSSFYPFNVPYYFQTSNNLGSFPKENPNSISSGKGIVVVKDGAQFSYSLGDITADNKKINFIKSTDITINPANEADNSLNKINNTLITEPFTLNNNSDFSFSVMTGLIDSTAALTALGNDGYVDYKVELIDVATSTVVGTLLDTKIGSCNLSDDNVSSFKVNTNGLDGKTVKARITISTNLSQPEYYLIERYSADGNVVGKLSGEVKGISVQGNEMVKSYALEQNYPNPFNPTTIINYQIPKDGFVTVKVFDSLGREVKTLVNEFKSQGKYSVNFDATHLASGVYFYQLKSGNYTSIKKMVLLK